MKFIYPAIIHDDSDGFWAEFPDLEYTRQYWFNPNRTCNYAQEAMELLYFRSPRRVEKVYLRLHLLRNLPCTDTTYPTLVQTDIDLAKNSKSVKKTFNHSCVA